MRRIFSRRAVLLSSLAVTACAGSGLAPLSPQDRQDSARVEGWLNALNGLQLPFTQIWPDGSRGSGTLTYTPGHLRLDYDVPRGMTLVAGDGHLVLTNPQSGAVTRMGLSHTPLGLLLARPIRLSGPVTVTAVQRQPGWMQISMAKTDRMTDGLLTLQFRDNGGVLTLAGLVLVDDRQHVVRLELGDAAG
ncbi:outer-membrane lipoprotein carrier protein [Acetobacter estunensis NRIC 0472]|uniref:Outer membrane lipoprotein carrier protein LolA n=1 Tax=Acetobacter estunensis TaxID=104097 RepID=A0A967ED56_9PROT|nr:outer membrane lipoprotein carrier protein LolA [Acetobacter estunensis]NHO53961.1 outer membrane lipoprotein carrier protein LolA [Acetobacter estunensis]GBQ26783.1 outer-membrane lipoprotein carrier protein [Acetobacter estunensis NRIC 0472]